MATRLLTKRQPDRRAARPPGAKVTRTVSNETTAMPHRLPCPPHRIARPAWRRAARLFVGVGLGLSLAACAAASGAEPAAPAPRSALPPALSKAAELQTAIRIEIGQPRCSADSQCRSLPVGHKACGGPDGHLAWSTTVSNEARLTALAREQSELRRQEVEARGLMSNCQVLADPGAVCRQGLCVLAPPGAAGASGGANPAR